jgi:phospholipid/cholesterol/gamma-HCH transport system substrate-binding protein/paraquat-inducible protein B
VGLFVLVGVVLIGSCTVILGGQGLFTDPILLETYFDESVQGLEVGSPVKLRGVQLGTVSQIGFVDDFYSFESAQDEREHGRKILVLMEVIHPPEAEITLEQRRRNLSGAIEAGLRLRLATSGITGTSFVQADYVSPERFPPMEIPWTPRNLYIPSAPSTMATITSAAERIVDRLEDLDVEKILQDLDALILSLTQAVDQLDVTALQRDLSAALGEVRGLVRNVDGRVEPIATGVEGTLGDAQEALSIAAEDSPVRYDLARTLAELADAARSVRMLADYLQQHPDALVYGKGGRGAR